MMWHNDYLIQVVFAFLLCICSRRSYLDLFYFKCRSSLTFRNGQRFLQRQPKPSIEKKTYFHICKRLRVFALDSMLMACLKCVYLFWEWQAKKKNKQINGKYIPEKGRWISKIASRCIIFLCKHGKTFSFFSFWHFPWL